MSGNGGGVNLNVRLRTDARPEQLLKEIILSPLIYIRLLGILFSIIVFGCISDQVLVPDLNVVGVETCLYNLNYSACTFPIAVGVIAFLLCIAFIIKDVLYVVIDYSENPMIKRVLLLVDAAFNGIWGFMWFVSFCLTADQLRQTNENPLFATIFTAPQRNCANSGVAFSFFATLAWGAIVGVNVFMFVRLSMGQGGGTSGAPSGYASFPEAGGDDGGDGDQHTQYKPPEY